LARSEADQNIVPHNLDLLALLWCHHCLEIIHSDQCIGYILKYCSKTLIFTQWVLWSMKDVKLAKTSNWNIMPRQGCVRRWNASPKFVVVGVIIWARPSDCSKSI
jgi:hypothetical protein